MKNINYKIFFLSNIFFLFFTFTFEVCAKKESHSPNWKEVLPEIGKELLPEETRETMDKLFPPHKKQGKAEEKNGSKLYHGDSQLRGKLCVPVKIFGKGELDHVTSNYEVVIKGKGVINNSCLKEVIVKTSLSAQETIFHSLTVDGPAYLKECQILGNAIVEGDLTAEHSTFDGSLRIAGKWASFNKSKASNIKFLGFSGKKTFTLEDSEIKGDIIFEGRPGKVILKKNSRIHGKVKNGVIKAEQGY